MNTSAEIITIGDDILIGQVVDTNSAWLAKNLNLIGIEVSQIISIADDKKMITNTLDNIHSKTKLILITGGLGPTQDDITKKAIVDYFETRLIPNKSVLIHIEQLVKQLNMEMNALNYQQADVPESAKILHNESGTAPGLWLEKNDKLYIFLPGVPYEMNSIFSNELMPLLIKTFPGTSIYHKTLMLFGIPESNLAMLIEPWEKALPQTIKLAYLPSQGFIRLRLSSKGPNWDSLQKKISSEVDKLMPYIEEYYYGEDDKTLEMVIGKLLKLNDKTVVTAESCTGGNIAHLLTSLPGSSAYFKGSIVAYSNEIKTSLLNVDEALLHNYGAVSEQVVKVMAEEVLELMHADYAIAVSGIAGPDGGTVEKPVGTVWIGIASKNRVTARKFLFESDRERNIRIGSYTALNELRKTILSDLEKK